MRIFLMGGGTGGSTAPLLAVAEALKGQKPGTELFLIGSKRGIETRLLQDTAIPIKYLTIPAGKLRRYFSLMNFVDIFKICFGFLKSLYLIGKYRPAILFGAGSYVQVPMAWAGYFMKIPIVIHQQDRSLLLSTKLVAPVAQAITITFLQNKEIPQFSGLFSRIRKSKIILTGNPARKGITKGSRNEAKKIFSLNDSFPTILAMGGSQGSKKINQAILAALPELLRYVQVIHITGGKVFTKKMPKYQNFHPYSFLGPELKHAYSVADLVVSRAGMSTITELALLGKPAILVPLPQSPQEENAALLSHLKCAVAVAEDRLEPELLLRLIRKILWNKQIQETLSKNISRVMLRDADEKIAKLMLKLAKKNVT